MSEPCVCAGAGNHEDQPIDTCDECPAPHVGHWSRLGGTWWCDTCNSPYCVLA